MDLSIIIVNYKSKSKLLRCLDSIYKQAENNLSWELIVVDNNSGDDLNSLTKTYHNLRLILSSRNLGMGGGNNLGLKFANGKFILILNPDTVINWQALKVLLNYLQKNSDVGLIGPQLVSPDGSLQLSCSHFPGFFMPIFRRTFLGYFFQKKRDYFMMQNFDHQSILEVDWLMGSCLMFKKEIELSSGKKFRPHFDERYFMYFEDIDFAREMWIRDLKVVYNPKAIITHDHQRQSAKYPWYLAIFVDTLAWRHISSWFKYFIKWGLKSKQYAKN